MARPRDNTQATRQRRGHPWQWLFGLFAAVIIVLAGIAAYFAATFNPNQYAPGIIKAVDQATGRQLTLTQPLRVHLSFSPEIEASGVALSNPAGFAAPDFLKIAQLKAQIALLPLLSHRLDVAKLTLLSPALVLDRDQAGRADWNFSAAKSSAPANPAAAPPTQPQGKPWQIAIKTVDVENGTLTINDAKPVVIAISNMTGTADSLAAPLHVAADAVLGQTPFHISGLLGPIERFSGIGDGPWPVDLTIALGSATASIKGGISHPGMGRGYDLTVNASIPNLQTAAASLPPSVLGGLALPPVQNITAQARIVDQDSAIPAIDNLSVKAGASDLSSFRPGLALSALDLEMASLDKPVSLTASGNVGTSPLSLKGNFGPPQALLNRAWLPASMPPQTNFPVAVSAQAGNATASVNGAIASPETLAGVALAIKASVPDLSTLGPLAGKALPDWKNINAQTTLIDPGGLGLRNAAGLDSLAVTMENAAFGGDASLFFGAAPRLQLAVKAGQVDFDALEAAMPAPPAPPAPAATPAPAAPGPAAPASPLPLGRLKTASADIQLSADTLIWRGVNYTALQAHGVLANGVFKVNPVTAQLPGGAMTANATLDATKDPAAETLNINAPALGLAPFLKAFGVPDTAQGTVQAQTNLSASGGSLAAVAASLSGQLGLALVNGVVDGSVMDKLFGSMLRTVGLPANLVDAQGPVMVRCAALRIDAANGIGTVRTLTLDSSRLLVQGGGTVNFGNQTLAVILRPQLQLIGTTLGVPVLISGSFENPVTQVAPVHTVTQAAQSAAGLPVNLTQRIFGNVPILGKAANALGLGTGPDVCPAALALGRLGQPGPAAPPPMTNAPTAAAPGAAPAQTGPKNLLNSLFGK